MTVEYPMGGITFEAPPKGHKAAGRIEGDIECHYYEGHFKGLHRTSLKPIRGKRYPKNTAFEIQSLIGNPNTEAGECWDEHENIVYLTDVQNDDGDPYLVLDWTEGNMGRDCYDGFCIGSREMPSDEELKWLGIGLSEKEVEEWAKAGSESEEGSENEGSAEVDGSSEGPETQEETPRRPSCKRGAGKALASDSKRRKI